MGVSLNQVILNRSHAILNTAVLDGGHSWCILMRCFWKRNKGFAKDFKPTWAVPEAARLEVGAELAVVDVRCLVVHTAQSWSANSCKIKVVFSVFSVLNACLPLERKLFVWLFPIKKSAKSDMEPCRKLCMGFGDRNPCTGNRWLS